jgi:prepilin-type N-terminal cleavage/methylation domain-containing protein
VRGRAGGDAPARARSRGFSLLEVLIAVAILAMALAAVLRMNAMNQQALIESRLLTTVSLLAASKCAELESVGLDKLAPGEGSFEGEYADFGWHVEIHSLTFKEARKMILTVASKKKPGTHVEIERYFVIPSAFGQPDK